ncbi:MAG: globin domain-containing protein [Pseudomonadota bacterium]
MTPDQARHVTFSLGRVFPYRAKLVSTFYEELFELAPGVRSLFPEDMTDQREKLLSTLNTVVTNLTELDKIIDAVRALGMRHVEYGATPAHYEVVGLALVTALKRATPGGLSKEEEHAWVTAYQLLSSTMIEAAEHHAGEGDHQAKSA